MDPEIFQALHNGGVDVAFSSYALQVFLAFGHLDDLPNSPSPFIADGWGYSPCITAVMHFPWK